MSSEDRAALVALFRSTGGARWDRNKNWATDAGLSLWEGVQVDEHDRVEELDLYENNLEGTIPEALGALTELKVLQLYGNDLTGPLPKALGALTELKELYLYRNRLTGSIPAWLGSLKNLNVLGLDWNQLGGRVPNALRALQELTHLGLAHNKLTGSIPAWLGSLGKLESLGLNCNQLAGPIPEALGALTELSMLYLDDNKLTGPIPTWLGSLSKLQRLGLDCNQLIGPIPEAVGALKELRILHLGDNKITGPIPATLGDLKKLTILELQGNRLTGHVPKELGNLENLRTLRLQNNQLTGTIPEELGNLTALRIAQFASSDWHNGNTLSGGPAVGEKLDSWRQRLKRPQETLKGSQKEELKGSHKDKNTPVPSLLTPPVLLPQQRETGEGGPAEDEGLGSWRERRWREELTKRHTPNVQYMTEEDAPVLSPPTPPVLLPQQRETDEGDEKEEDVAVPPPVLLPQQQETGEGDLNEVFPISPYSPRPTWITEHLGTYERNEEVEAPRPTWMTEQLETYGRAAPRPTWITEHLETYEGDEKEEDAPASPTSFLPLYPLQQQEAGEGEPNEEDAPLPLGSPDQRHETVGERARSPERASWSAEKAEVDELFRAQLLSSAGLGSLIRENSEALEDVQHVIEEIVAGQFSPGDECSGLERCRELGTFVAMSTALGEVVLKHTEDSDVKRKELALPTFWREYFTTVRSGLCKAYLAASVIDSDWVSTSKTGGMGKVGVALKLMSSAVPLVGGLPELAGKALETGDHYLQTRRLVKITALAPDAMECCSLARRLALELADGLRSDSSATADDTDQVRVDATAGMKGGSGSRQGADMLPGDMSEEGVFDYLLEEVASYESNDHGGSRLGKQHLRKLLKAVQRGCLDGSTCIEEKIKALLAEILPEAHITPAAMSSTPKEVILRSPPVVAPAHDSELPSRAEFAGMQAALEVLTCAKDKQQEELEAIKLDKEKQQEELKAMGSANKMLQYKVKHLEKYAPDLDSEPGDDVDLAGGLALRRRVAVTETAEGFLDRARDRAAAAADHHPVTVSEQREFEALQNEKHREHEARFRELEGEISKAAKGKGRR